jgi:ABC-type transporter Mla subunit MlaD
MPLPQQYNNAIMNLGNIEDNVNVMTQQARILNRQREQTFDILNRLRTLIRKLLTSYSGNKDTLQQVYNDIMTATTTAGEKQRNLLEQLASELKKSLENPRTEQNFTELKEGVEALIREMENVSGPGAGAGAGAGAGDASSGAGDASSGAGDGDGAGDGAGSGSDVVRGPIIPTGVGMNPRNKIDTFNYDNLLKNLKSSSGGANVKGKKKRSTKRGGYSWRTPSPNKSRKKTPTYKKTIKKTRTRQN